MKIIEALKLEKDLARKCEDLTKKIGSHCADMDFETPLYADQRGQVEEWLQAVSDVLKERLRLRVAVQRTNLATDVTIELGGRQVTKTIAEWVHRRRDLAVSFSSDKPADRAEATAGAANALADAIQPRLVK